MEMSGKSKKSVRRLGEFENWSFVASLHRFIVFNFFNQISSLKAEDLKKSLRI